MGGTLTEQFSKEAFQAYDPHCWSCGREVKFVKDVGDARVIVAGNVKRVRCVDCCSNHYPPNGV